MWFYREDAKGGAAHSVRDRFTAPLRSVCTASVFSASSANLAKIAHRGRNGLTAPRCRLCALPQLFRKKECFAEKGRLRRRTAKTRVPLSLLSLLSLLISRVFAYLSGRCVTCHLQARRQACTARAKPSFRIPKIGNFGKLDVVKPRAKRGDFGVKSQLVLRVKVSCFEEQCNLSCEAK